MGLVVARALEVNGYAHVSDEHRVGSLYPSQDSNLKLKDLRLVSNLEAQCYQRVKVWLPRQDSNLQPA